MSVEDQDKIDFITIENGTGNVLLTLTDHLNWEEDEDSHLEMLQAKLNAYMRFIESGEIYQQFPQTIDRVMVINFVSKFPPSEKATAFIDQVRDAIEGAGYLWRFELLQPS